ncbi:MAG: histidine kinase [Propioniciclava sp.]|uniref:sensor histidine kinase n=1 Tax=Propioniciclava sp. TaxID=2038686 RepID=UPI0039E6C137
MSILRGVRTAGIVVACLLAGVLAQLSVWALRFPDLDAIPDDEAVWVVLVMLAETAGGLLAVALLPLVIGVRAVPGRRAGIAGVVVVLLSASAFAFPASILALGAVASWRRRGWLIAASVAWVTAQVPAIIAETDLWLGLVGALLLAVPIGAVVVSIGLYLGGRDALLVSLRERAEALEREQAAVVAQTQFAERTRIAREMHDTLSHRLSLISLHAGGLAVRPDAGPDRVEETARLIQQAAQTASEELHAVLTVLRDDQHDVRLDPTLADLDALTAAPGVDVRLAIAPVLTGRLGDLAPSASRALARVVAEGIANAVKHAPGLPVAVYVAGMPGERAQVEVRNPVGSGSSLAGGYGLVGLRERIELAGGQLAAGRDGGDFVLRAWVPWT